MLYFLLFLVISFSGWLGLLSEISVSSASHFEYLPSASGMFFCKCRRYSSRLVFYSDNWYVQIKISKMILARFQPCLLYWMNGIFISFFKTWSFSMSSCSKCICSITLYQTLSFVVCVSNAIMEFPSHSIFSAFKLHFNEVLRCWKHEACLSFSAVSINVRTKNGNKLERWPESWGASSSPNYLQELLESSVAKVPLPCHILRKSNRICTGAKFGFQPFRSKLCKRPHANGQKLQIEELMQSYRWGCMHLSM